MALRKRSNDGCWTCRVRRKKCDEEKSSCLACLSLQITCYGYGAKPEWMDGAAKEREMAVMLRSATKKTSGQRLRTRLRQSKHQLPESPGSALFSCEKSTGFSKIDPVQLSQPTRLRTSPDHLTNSDEEVSETVLSRDQHSKSCKSASLLSKPDMLSDPRRLPQALALTSSSIQKTTPLNFNTRISNKSVVKKSTEYSWGLPPSDSEEDQASLLMHYLDHVFPLQFRFYAPSILDGGRGWLLSILVGTKPLYHAALTLAAHHQQSVLSRMSAARCRGRQDSLEKLLQRHILSMEGLRHHLEIFHNADRANSLKDAVEVLACIALLISIEIYSGFNQSWHIHLQAVSALVPVIKSSCLANRGATLSNTHQSALVFFSGVIAWYDILSCAFTGSKPLTDSTCLKEGSGFMPLEKLMGCENWAMRLILDVAFLDEWKKRQGLDNSSTLSLRHQAAGIKQRLEEGLDQNRKNFEGLKESLSTAGGSSFENECKIPTNIITRVFACSTLVYLQVVTSGPYPQSPGVREGVLRTIEAFEFLTDKDLIKCLLWPACIAGCMALAEQEMFFRNLISAAETGSMSFENPSNALKIMEECWRMRDYQNQNGSTFNWVTAMRSAGVNTLLV